MKWLVPILLLTACSTVVENKNEGREVNKSIISDIMLKQQQAWNNGNLDAFMQAYEKSESLRFVGKSGLNKGWQKTFSNYKKSYPTQEIMGNLLFENLEFKPLGPEYYLVIGKWNLFRTSDTLQGHYSLVWKKENDGWKIIADHSS